MQRHQILAIGVVLVLVSGIAWSKPQAKSSQDSNQKSNEWTLRGRLAADPHDESAYEQLCSLLKARGDYRSLVEERRQWLRHNPSNWLELSMLTAEVRTYLDDPEYAVGVYREYLNQSGLDQNTLIGTYADLGLFLAERRKYSEAIVWLSKAAQMMPQVFSGDLGKVMLAAGQVEQAISTLKKAVASLPGSAVGHAQLADALRKAGDHDRADTEYRVAMKLAPEIAAYKLSLARSLIERQRYKEASVLLDAAVASDPYARMLRAQMFDKQGEIDKAIVETGEVRRRVLEELKSDPKLKEVTDPLTAMAAVESDWQDVIRLLEPVKASGRLLIMDHRILGEAYLRVGRKTEGVKQIHAAFSLAAASSHSLSKSAKAQFSAAELLAQFGASEHAAKYYQKAYELDPQNVTYRLQYEASRQSGSRKSGGQCR